MPESIPSLLAVPELPTVEETTEMDDFDERRQPEELIVELDALNAAARAAEAVLAPQEARKLVEVALGNLRRLGELSPSECVVGCAMARIAGLDLAPFVVTRSNDEGEEWEMTVLETVMCAWTEWAAGRTETALTEIPRLKERQATEQHIAENGAVNLMALYLWAGAVEALAQGKEAEAKRLWKRALQLGSHFGADVSPLIQWTFAASFFPRQ